MKKAIKYSVLFISWSFALASMYIAFFTSNANYLQFAANSLAYSVKQLDSIWLEYEYFDGNSAYRHYQYANQNINFVDSLYDVAQFEQELASYFFFTKPQRDKIQLYTQFSNDSINQLLQRNYLYLYAHCIFRKELEKNMYRKGFICMPVYEKPHLVLVNDNTIGLRYKTHENVNVHFFSKKNTYSGLMLKTLKNKITLPLIIDYPLSRDSSFSIIKTYEFDPSSAKKHYDFVEVKE